MKDFERENNQDFIGPQEEQDGSYAKSDINQHEKVSATNARSETDKKVDVSSEAIVSELNEIPLSQENIPSQAEAKIIIDTAISDDKANSYTYNKKDLGSNAIDSFHSQTDSSTASPNQNHSSYANQNSYTNQKNATQSSNTNQKNATQSSNTNQKNATQSSNTNDNQYKSQVYSNQAYNNGANSAKWARENGSSIPYSEHIKVKDNKKKEKKSKRYVAAMLAGAVFNLAVLGGAFALGHSFGKDNGTADTKASLSESLRDEGNNPSQPSGTTGATGTASTTSSSSLETIDVAKEVGPAVVGIKSKVQGQMSLFGGYSSAESQGSGIIISNDGYIITNNHVVASSTEVSVLLNTGSEYPATVIGLDDQTDLAIIKIEPKEEITVASLGDSTKVEVGETAIAIGNPMGVEFFGSVTQGIISAVNRTVEVDNRTMNLLQTDAAINTGNSGGALVNDRAEVIGINAVKVSTSGVEGMGFAIPISEAKPIISDLLDYGYVKGRPVIGLSTRDVSSYMAQQYGWPQGAQIMAITTQNAKDAGLEQGDIITAVDGNVVASGSDLTNYKDTKSPGDTVELEVYKYSTGNSEKVKVLLSEQIPE